MQKYVFYLTSVFILGAASALAQADSSAPAAPQPYYSHAFYSASHAAGPNAPEWILTLDVIKAKTEALMGKNSKLMAEREALIREYKEKQETIRSWQAKNQDLREFLKKRHGRSNEEMKVDELAEQIKAKKEQLKVFNEQLLNLNKELESAEQKLQLKRLRISDLQLKRNQDGLEAKMQQVLKQQEITEDDAEMIGLKQQFQKHKEQETALEGQVKELEFQRMGAAAMPPVVDEQQIKVLEEKVQSLRQQKEDLQKQFNSDNTQAGLQRYQQLMARKKELEDKIKGFDTQLSQLNSPQAKGLSENKTNKQLLKQMVQLDSQNARLRQKISIFGENVALLKTQVKRLERRFNVTKGSPKKTK